MTTIEDDRTVEQRETHKFLVIGTDKFLSGWGGASGGTSVAAWACETGEEADRMERWVSGRSDMRRVRVVYDGPNRYRPSRSCAHLHVYVVGKDHPGLR